MEFRIPESAEAPLAEFIKLSSEQRERLVDAIRQSKPALLVPKFANEVASQWGEDARKVEEIITVFAGMYLARIDVDETVDDFVAALSSVLRKRGEKQLMPQDEPGFQQSLKSILSAEDSLGI